MKMKMEMEIENGNQIWKLKIPYEKSRRDMGQILAIKKDANQRDMIVTSHGDNRQ